MVVSVGFCRLKSWRGLFKNRGLGLCLLIGEEVTGG